MQIYSITKGGYFRMKSNKFYKVLLAMLLVLSLALVACSGDDDGDDGKDKGDSSSSKGNGGDEEDVDKGEEILSQFEQSVSNEGEPIEGGDLTFGLVSDEPFKGTLNWNFYSGAPDAEVLEWFDESLLHIDGDYLYDQEGAATWEHNEEGDVFTFTIHDDVNWHDGEPVTAEDWAFAHEVIGHEDYTGPRFDETLRNVEGIEDYHNGEADEISGIEVIDDKTLEITYVESTPSLLSGGIWSYALPKHIFGDLEVADMESSDAVRKNPIGMGPFKVDTIVAGESVTYTKNEDYWRGEPNLDNVTLKVIAISSVAQAIATGEVDLVNDFPADQYPDSEDLSNVEFLAAYDNYFSYLGFNLGEWDFDNSEVVENRDTPLEDKNLRKAMSMAIDGDTIGEEFYHGLRWEANSIIDPAHRVYHDSTWDGYEFDPEAAIALLEDSGYERGDDDFFTDLDGNEMVLQYAAMTGGETAEPLANLNIQMWEEIGINVELYTGKLLAFEDFYDRIGNSEEEDDPDVDIFGGAWGTGSDVDKTGLYGKKAKFNFSRWDNEESEQLLKNALSEDAFDLDYRKEAYKEWHELMVDEVPVFPLNFALLLKPANNRVVNYSIDPDVDSYYYEIGVTDEDPAVD